MTLVAVLGGGQLGRMLGLAGIPLGLELRFLDPSPVAPAQAVGELVVGGLGDEPALHRTAAGADVVTYEWEGVPAGGARALESAGFAVVPSTRALELSQDRLAEKALFRELGIGTPGFVAVADADGLRAAAEQIGLPAVVKTRRGGYDGKGQAVLREPRDLDRAWDALSNAGPLLLEELVPFDRELSVLAVRSRTGETRCWPLVENRHEGGILRESRAPARSLPDPVRAEAERAAGAVLDHFDYAGVMALELFQIGDALLANELAPRVHNSGHWTIEGAVTSQFENHLRAILGWPLGSTAALGAAGMVNCIGTLPDPAAVLGVEGAHLHCYGKEPRSGRKVGHVTVTAPDPHTLDARLAAVRSALSGGSG